MKWLKKKCSAGVLLLFLMILLLPVQASAAGKVRALVVSGNDLFGHKEAAGQMASALKDNILPGYTTDSGDIRTMSYHGTAKAEGKGTTVEEFKAAIKSAFGKSTGSDLNIFFYSGHGAELSDGEHAIVLNKETGIRFSAFAQELAKYSGKYILIFNACHDGAVVTEGIASLSERDQKRFTSINAVSAGESSILTILPDLMMKGIGIKNGYTELKADSNHDGMITTKELASYAGAQRHYGSDQVLFHFEKIDLKKSSAVLYTGKGMNTTTLGYTRKLSDPEIMESKNYIKWYSSDNSVASVNEVGKVTAKKEGKVTIRAEYYGTLGRYQGAGDKCVIIVKKPKITVKAVTAGKLYTGKTKKLKAVLTGTKETVSWSSSDKSVATVNSKGVVTAKKAGTAVITAENSEAKGTYKIRVYKPTISLEPASVQLKTGAAKTIKAIVQGASQKVTWSSSNSEIATVNKNGKITAKKAGEVTITAKANGVKAACKVTVEEKDYKELYYRFLKKAETSYTYKNGSYTCTAVARSFYLLHLNSDKIPELIVCDQQAGTWGYAELRVFTIKNQKVVYCGGTGTRMGAVAGYNTKYKALHTGGWINGIGGAYDILWKVSGKKFKEYKYALEYESNGERVNQTGTSSSASKVVTAADAASFTNTYFNPKHLKNYNMLNNTEANRVKKFK